MAKKSEPQKASPKSLDVSELMRDNDQPNFLNQMQEDFKKMMIDKQVLQKCIETFLDEIIDQLTLGIIFDLHRKFKTKAYCLEVKENEEEADAEQSEELPLSPVKSSPQKCVCPNCAQQVAALRFARHLAKCMGLSNNSRSSRNASRRAATNKEKGASSSSSYSANSDDDNDEDWNPRMNRKKDKSFSPKKKGTPKRSSEPDLAEAINTDTGETDEAKNLRHTRSNSSSPDSLSGSGNITPKKRDKFKKMGKGKERSSASTSLKFD
ncbi:unnamed protein product [Ceutorhynchus assimilis]|uniref:SAGA-associated factor 11 n=1 Tax=Ceutorhynchus assimilis TaxID=467358 RepID=A0A9N9QLU5_9CUCU|nr:unnamed protein product [Ceutorhynchus assimilis]